MIGAAARWRYAAQLGMRLRATMLALAIGSVAIGACAGAGDAAQAQPARAAAKRVVKISGWKFRCRRVAKHISGSRRTCRLKMTLAPLRPPARIGNWQPNFGFNEDWLTALDHLDLAGGLGSETARVQFNWAAIEPAPGVFDWHQYDLLYRAMTYRGIRPLLTLQASPCWARPGTPCGGSPNYPPDPRFDQQWAQFVQLALHRYPLLEGLELWNEPNLNAVWLPAPDPVRYARLLRVTYGAAKAVEPGLPVLFGGLVPQFGPSSRAMGARVFQRTAYAAGAGRFTDAISVHPYVFPSDSPYLFLGVRTQLAIPKRIAGRFRYPATPLWVTETGLSTTGQGRLSGADQASRLAGLYELLRRVPGVPVVIFHRLLDVRGPSGDWLNGMGIASPNGTVKPAYCALASARHLHCPYS
jgi:polysaccharide biosynthesis protein PslG